jgi:diaminopimelate decarboxylase
MKTSVLEQLYGQTPTVDDIIRETIVSDNCEDAFYVVDIQDILRKHKNWLLKMPRVQPFYAVKCNGTPIVLELLASLGIGFDCASKAEIDSILSLGVSPKNIIYANPCKTKSFIKHAADVGVDVMTFDNELELYKVAQLHPNARMVLRIKVDDSHSVCRLGLKFGADIERAHHLLQTAKNIGVNIIGCSFHVGSGCESSDAYTEAISNAKYVFELGRELGFDMTFLDIGGGFPGTSITKVTFDEAAKAVNEALDLHFPATDEFGNHSNITIIAEPGRYYVASAFTLATNIIAKRAVPMEDQQIAMMYYLNDGVYGSFNCTIFDHWEVHPIPFHFENCDDGLQLRQNHLTTIWGPTCDSMDCIKRDIVLPELHIGEWIIFREMGAYTIAAGSTFNGFKMPSLQYHVPSYTLEMLQKLPNWSRISQILDINGEESTPMDSFDADHCLEIIPVH